MRLLCQLIFFVLLSISLFAQIEKSIKIDGQVQVIQDSLAQFKEDSIDLVRENSGLLSMEAGYSSKVIYRGRDFGLIQHGFNSVLTYKIPSGLYFNLNNYNWSGIHSPIAKTDLGIGLDKDISEYFNINCSYERWFLANDTFFLGMNYNNMILSALSTNFERLNGELGIYYLWGKENAYLIEGTTEYKVELPSTTRDFHWNLNLTFNLSFYASDKVKNDTTRFFSNNAPFLSIKSKYTLQSPSLVNYEALLKLNIEYRNLVITPAYHYNYPISVSYEDPPLSQYLKSGFGYFSLNVLYNLYFLNQNGRRK
jgi:hypothetical protein